MELGLDRREMLMYSRCQIISLYLSLGSGTTTCCVGYYVRLVFYHTTVLRIFIIIKKNLYALQINDPVPLNMRHIKKLYVYINKSQTMA